MEQHLAVNQVALQKTPATLGAMLKLDPASEQAILDLNVIAATRLTTGEPNRPGVGHHTTRPKNKKPRPPRWRPDKHIIT